ncbi:hypothetical protein XbrCFBP1976_18025 [Xanthomonas bromi]|uniref:Uncharacterized protein n=1 Tax=Xanthomonas bromi TaxID=56449 RepID=A0ABX5BMW7_9XANT|nr:hypothetical protein XbrCFBP1976_18025 [Xanthomonas bromi]
MTGLTSDDKRVATRRQSETIGCCRASIQSTLTPTPAPRPGPRLRRGRSKARAPVARKLCLIAPRGEGLKQTARA